MAKENARKQTLEQLHERRKQVVRLHRRGIKIMQIVVKSGLSYPAVRATMNLYEAGGWSAIRPAVRGRSKGEGRVLNAAQEWAIQRLICEQRPDQLGLGMHLWSRPAVMQLIGQECGVELQLRSVGKYLTRWGFTPQKPIDLTGGRHPQAVLSWLSVEYLSIEKRARAQGGEIHWMDTKAWTPSDTPAAEGQPPHTMVATITNQGKPRWMLIEAELDAERLITFLNALIQDAGRKVFVILDNRRVYHRKLVKTWVAQHAEHLELVHLPRFWPQPPAHPRTTLTPKPRKTQRLLANPDPGQGAPGPTQAPVKTSP
jgi:transposase